MILLETLSVENFKSLRHVELRFPRTGSVLVEGLNEAGKSSLFESIYFALYGAPLVTETPYNRSEEVLRYGTDVCAVALTLDVDGTRLEVHRVVRRNRPSQATLVVRRPGAEPETVQGVRAATARIVEELGKLDGDALLNSCFVEQKKLSKLEDLGADKRKESLLRLLNLEKLAELEAEFRPTRADEDAVAQAGRRRELAEVRREVPELEAERSEVDRLLRAIETRRDLDSLVEQRRVADEAADARRQLETQRESVQASLNLADRLRQAAERASQILGHWEAVAAESERAAKLGEAIAELSRRETEDLPAAERRHSALLTLVGSLVEWEARQVRLAECERELADLARLEADRHRLREEAASLAADLAERRTRAENTRSTIAKLDAEEANDLPRLEAEREALQALATDLETHTRAQAELAEKARELEALRSRREDAARLEREATELEGELRRGEPELALARGQVDEAREALRLFQLEDALAEWVRLRRSTDALAQQNETFERQEREVGELREGVEALRAEVGRRAAGARGWGMLAGAAAIVAVALAAIGVLPVTLVLFAAALGFGALAGREQAAASQLRVGLATSGAALTEQEDRLKLRRLEREAAARLGGDAATLRRCEETLRALEEVCPANAEAGEARQREVAATLGGRDRAATSREASVAEARWRELERARQDRESAVAVLRRQLCELDPAGLDRKLAEQAEALARLDGELARREAELAARLSDWGLPAEAGRIREEVAGRKHRIEALTARLEGRGRLRAELAEAQSQIADRERRAAEVEAKLGQHDDAELAERAEALRGEITATEAEVVSRRAALEPEVAEYGLLLESAAAREAAARVAAGIEALRRELAGRAGLERELEGREQTIAGRRKQIGEVEAALSGLALDGPVVPTGAGAVEYQAYRDEAERRRVVLDEPGLRARLGQLNAGIGREEEKEATAARQQQALEARLRASLAELGAGPDLELELVAVEASLPVVAAAATADEAALVGQRQDLLGRLEIRRHRQAELERLLQLAGVELDVEECRAEEARLTRGLEVKRRAVRIVTEARKRMVAKVLPNTERNVRLLLPLLTAGRYHDAHITEDYRIEVWDEGAGRYVAKSIFSGGTKDQFSLALRLAFALATLPQELGTTPGFIFLDEPLSSFDAQRTQALVELLTHGQIAANFRQIFVISHSRSFDASAFPYRLRMDSGQVAESNLA